MKVKNRLQIVMDENRIRNIFRPADELFTPDPWHKVWVKIDLNSGRSRSLMIDDIYESLDSYVLNDFVPANVWNQFDLCKALIAYSWYCHKLLNAADRQIFSTIELALKEKAKTENLNVPRGLRNLLKLANQHKWLRDINFSHIRLRHEADCEQISSVNRGMEALGSKEGTEEPPELSQDTRKYCEILEETLPQLRNEYLHGSDHIYAYGTFTHLSICFDIIQQLFSEFKK